MAEVDQKLEPFRLRNHAALLITFDGLDGSGKTTQIMILEERLRKLGCAVKTTSDLNSSKIGRRIKEIVNSSSTSSDKVSDLLLIHAARTINLQEEILPALSSGKVVISDRFQASTYAYNFVGRGAPAPLYYSLEENILDTVSPALQIILDIGVSRKNERILKRGGVVEKYEKMGHAYFEKVRQAFWDYAAKHGAVVLDASQDRDSLSETIFDLVNQRLIKDD